MPKAAGGTRFKLAIAVGTPTGRRDNILSFALTICGGMAQGWALINLGFVVGDLLSDPTQASTGAGGHEGALAFAIISALIAAICQFAAQLNSRASAQEQEAAIRAQGLRHLFALGPARTRAYRSGSTVSMLTDGAERIAAYRQTFVAPTLAAAASPAAVLILLALTVDWVPALILLVAVALIPPFILRVHRRVRRSSSGSRRQRTRLSAEYLDAIQGLTTLVLARAARRTQERLRAAGEDNRQAVMGLLAGNQLVIFLTDCLFSLFFVVASAALALTRLNAGAIDLGGALAIILVAYTILQPLDHVGAFFYVAMGGMANQRALRRLLALRPGVSTAPEAPQPVISDAAKPQASKVPAAPARQDQAAAAGLHSKAEAPGSVELTGVSAGWDAEHPVLQDVNLTIHPGQRVAVVGPSGAGKSTLVSMISGDLLPDNGRAVVGGITLEAGQQEDVRAHSAVVAQTTWLFTGTIADNLRLAKPEASDEDMWRALEDAYLAEDVRAMPQGLDTALGEVGLGLSGGQAQRLSLARAILSRRPLLILDEPTSQVDLESEAHMVRAIEELDAERTVITVSHRAGALVHADTTLTVAGGHLHASTGSQPGSQLNPQPDPQQPGSHPGAHTSAKEA